MYKKTIVAIKRFAGYTSVFMLFAILFPTLRTRLGGLLIVPVMLGAIFMMHWGQWHFAASETHPMGGMEFQSTLLMIALYFVVVGNKAPTPTQTA